MAAQEKARLASRSAELKVRHSAGATGSKRIKSENCTHHQELFPKAGTRHGADSVRNPESGGKRRVYGLAAGLSQVSAKERALANLPSDYKLDETDRDEGGEDHSPDQDHSPHVVPQSLTNFEHGARRAVNSGLAAAKAVDIVGVDNAQAVASVASVAPLAPVSWIGKRQRTSQVVASSQERGAIQVHRLLLQRKMAATSSASQNEL